MPPNIAPQWLRSCASGDELRRGVSLPPNPIARQEASSQKRYDAGPAEYGVAQRPHRCSAAANGMQLPRRDEAMDVLVGTTPPTLQSGRAHIAIGQQPINQCGWLQELSWIAPLCAAQPQHGGPPNPYLRAVGMGCPQIKCVRDAAIIDTTGDLLGRARKIAAQYLAGSETMIARNGQRQP
ncbi:MAG: hypothetical protein E6R03_13580 [Hyphomicrobiaceae bacterium]|nr:MAG: hypothetical protein E6R03_13580 [Hyphomicrobiaceae bacterium]